jgi:hypothetical protein
MVAMRSLLLPDVEATGPVALQFIPMMDLEELKETVFQTVCSFRHDGSSCVGNLAGVIE